MSSGYVTPLSHIFWEEKLGRENNSKSEILHLLPQINFFRDDL